MRYKIGQKVKCSCGSHLCPKGTIMGYRDSGYMVHDDNEIHYMEDYDVILMHDNKRKDYIAFDPKNKPMGVA